MVARLLCEIDPRPAEPRPVHLDTIDGRLDLRAISLGEGCIPFLELVGDLNLPHHVRSITLRLYFGKERHAQIGAWDAECI